MTATHTKKMLVIPPAMAAVKFLDDLDVGGVGVEFAEKIGGYKDKFVVEEELVFVCNLGKVREKMSTRFEVFQPPKGDLRLLLPEELS